MLLYLMVWEPYQKQRDSLQQQLVGQLELRDYMRSAAKEARSLGGTQQKQAVPAGSLLSQSDSSARKQGLGQALKRVEPDGQSRVRVWLEKAEFDAVMRWLAQLRRDYGVQVNSMVFDRQDEPGLINGRIVLERSGATGNN